MNRLYLSSFGSMKGSKYVLTMLVDTQMIIIADDDKYAVDFFKSALKNIRREFRLITCENTDELVKYLSNPNNVRPLILFLGVNMPITSGLESLQKIRQRFSPNDLPVAVYSNHANRALTVTTRKMGADYCITKPNSSIILENLIEQLVLQVEASAMGNRKNQC